jgi:hypothetical protein
MYDGNPNLRACDEEITYTKEMQEEYIKCMTDILYFAEKYCYIVSNDKGLHIIKLWEFQKKILKAMVDPPKYNNGSGGEEKKQHCIALCPRQMSKTTMSALFLVHFAIFHQNKDSAILANKEKTALEIMSRVKLMIENLPLWLQPGVREWNKGTIHFGNGCRIIATSTSSSAIRGYTLANLLLDEFAFVPTNVCEEFMNSVWPTVSSSKNTKIIIVSTPNGMNHFYTLWTNSVRGKNNFFPIKVNWWEHPERDDSFKKNMIRDRGLVFWQAEFNCIKHDTKVKIRSKLTGREIEVSVENLYNYGQKIFEMELL